MSDRNRSEGWKHAKNTGHENEKLLAEDLRNNISLQHRFLIKINKIGNKIIDVEYGGIFEKDIDSIFINEKTKSKSDLKVTLDDGSIYNISLKKSLSGQVYLIPTNRFINGFELQYNKKIPDDVKKAIELFWGYSKETDAILDKNSTKPDYEYRKRRLVGDTLKIYNKHLYDVLLSWFKENIVDITDFCFSTGLAKDKDTCPKLIWYKNELGENKVDEIIYLPALYDEISKKLDKIEIVYGDVGGGTTLQLPFGFVQWHSPRKVIPGMMQFHHNYYKLLSLIEDYLSALNKM